MILALQDEKGPRQLEVRRQGDTYSIMDGDESMWVDARALAGGLWSLLVGARSYSARVTRSGNIYNVAMGGHNFAFELTDPSRAALLQGGAAASGPGQIRAPMPGRVLRILVQPGESVARGQGVVVVEAMKMENELTAPRDGIIEAISVKVGETVEGGAPLVLIGDDPAAQRDR